jgi:hypothetical protein
VVASRQYNFSQQHQYFNYSLITPNVVDLAAYQAALGQLTQVVQGLASGQPPWQSPGSPCNSPIPALQGCAQSSSRRHSTVRGSMHAPLCPVACCMLASCRAAS